MFRIIGDQVECISIQEVVTPIALCFALWYFDHENDNPFYVDNMNDRRLRQKRHARAETMSVPAQPGARPVSSIAVRHDFVWMCSENIRCRHYRRCHTFKYTGVAHIFKMNKCFTS